LIKADFHMHTEYSMDCEMKLEDIIERCLKMELDCIAISDHGTIEGALKLREMAPFKVIVAEEVLTPNGEIMGFFLEEAVPSGISVDEAIKRIKVQGGAVGLPHPFDPFRGLTLPPEEIEALADKIDFVEVFNARSPINSTADKALDYAARYNLPGTAGSDSHSVREIGRTYVEMPDFETIEEFLEALPQGTISQHKASLLVHLNTTWIKIKHKLTHV
jgi:predicted metal-dependent phosphoesterase TrpH